MTPIGIVSSRGIVMFVFAQQVDPGAIVEAAKGGPAYLLAFILAGVLAYLVRKDLTQREDQKIYREDSKDQRLSHQVSIDKIVNKVTTSMDKNTAVLGELGIRVTRVEDRVGDVEDTLKIDHPRSAK